MAMNRKVVIVGSVAGVLIGFVVFVAMEPTRIGIGVLRGEAFYRGRPTSYWQSYIAADAADGQISDATLAAFDWDPRAADVLLECVAHQDSNVRWPSVLLLQRCGSFSEQTQAFRSLVYDPDRQVRILAIRGLGRLEREALSALPQLTEMAKSSDADDLVHVVYALWSIDPETARRAENWSEFTSELWGFRVEFPGEIETDVRKAMLFDSDLYEFWAWSGPSRFTVVLTFEAPGATATIEERYEMAPQIAAQAMGGIVKEHVEIEQSGIEGRDQTIEQGEHVVRTRVFIIGERVYQAQVVYRPEFLHPSAVEYFLDSFLIRWRPEAPPT
jgi:hypothetical protein